MTREHEPGRPSGPTQDGRVQPSDPPGVLPGTPAGEPSRGPGILPGTPEELDEKPGGREPGSKT